jgi:hypothetical protein
MVIGATVVKTTLRLRPLRSFRWRLLPRVEVVDTVEAATVEAEVWLHKLLCWRQRWRPRLVKLESLLLNRVDG